MRTLHLCAGQGGGLLADLILGHTIVGAVEYDPFAQRVLRARQASGHLPAFPIHDNVRTFDGRSWRGAVDVVAGGIPCQGFSGAGKQLGADDPRNLWPDALRILRETRAPWFFFENVANLTSFDYWGVILQDLAAAGYDARWCVLSAGDVGAPHLRKRVWLLATDTDAFRVADAGIVGCNGWTGEQGAGRQEAQRGEAFDYAGDSGQSCAVADANGLRNENRVRLPEVGRSDLPDADGGGGSVTVRAGGPVGDPSGAGLPQRQGQDGERAHAAATGAGGRHAQPDVGRMADGLADRLDRPGWWSVERGLPRVAGKQPGRDDRLRGLGNGQVALCAAAAWKLLGGP